MEYPTYIGSGRVEGRFLFGVVDGPDSGEEPDYLPAKGPIVFSASVPYITVETETGPVTIALANVTAVLNDEGILCTPDPDDPTKPGYEGVRLFANNDPDSSVQNWTWKVTYKLQPIPGSTIPIETHSISLGVGETRNLGDAVKVPSSPGVGVPQYEAAVLRAEAAASDAADDAAIAQTVVDRADAGEFKGDQGDPGNATMRIDNTVGKRVFITDGTSEHLISADTDWRDITGDVVNGWTATKLQLRRVDNMVLLRAKGLDGTAVDGSTNGKNYEAVRLPSGFSSGGSYFSFALSFNEGGQAFANAHLNLGEGKVYGSPRDAQLFWVTTDNWPSALPGTPA